MKVPFSSPTQMEPSRQYRDRSRSRSPHHQEPAPKRSRRRSGSLHRHLRKTERKAEPTMLPFDAKRLSRHDLSGIKPMLGLYLDIQKQIFIDDLSEDEIKGRWKSFLGKWNRGELAEGWYDPKTLEKALASAQDDSSRPSTRKQSPSTEVREVTRQNDKAYDSDEYGPTLPDPGNTISSDSRASTSGRAGPSIPKFQDLLVAREVATEEAIKSRQDKISELQHERRLDRKVQSELLEELAPKAAPGTRERQLEKRREVAESNRAFAASKDGGDVDIREADVMGDEDSLSDIKRMQAANERKKNERELRREENLRTRRAETEERVKGMREREEKTMSTFKEIAKARFG